MFLMFVLASICYRGLASVKHLTNDEKKRIVQEMYDDYKANRKEMPEDLPGQIDRGPANTFGPGGLPRMVIGVHHVVFRHDLAVLPENLVALLTP